MYPIVFI